MKILLDTCVWGEAKKELTQLGYDVVWSGDWEKDPGDNEILTIAYKEKRVLVTLDKDFGELAIVHQIPHCGILRLVNISARQQAKICKYVFSIYAEELLSGAIITAEEDRLRVRPPENF